MHKTAQQLIREAYEAANGLPPASAALLKELASRLDISMAATSQACDERSAAINTLTATRVNSGCPESVDIQDWVKQLAAENVIRQEFVKICFRAAADGASLDGADIQEVGGRLGLFGRETYQPMLHGYICGHEAGEDSVYVMKSTPVTDLIVAGVKADAFEEAAVELERVDTIASTRVIALKLREFSKQLREVSANG
ncbi:hypothetical protein [Raoultella ornithinolytica]|uniref:hypothetical protein n=1 Tax=Raoultella ornithinolytica TaxID=54291 RepID=UPI000AD23305|nr:hypothetical protein [Raoultella ornithinolytica]